MSITAWICATTNFRPRPLYNNWKHILVVLYSFNTQTFGGHYISFSPPSSDVVVRVITAQVEVLEDAGNFSLCVDIDGSLERTILVSAAISMDAGTGQSIAIIIMVP